MTTSERETELCYNGEVVISSLRLLGNEVQMISVYLPKAMQNSASVRTCWFEGWNFKIDG